MTLLSEVAFLVCFNVYLYLLLLQKACLKYICIYISRSGSWPLVFALYRKFPLSLGSGCLGVQNFRIFAVNCTGVQFFPP